MKTLFVSHVSFFVVVLCACVTTAGNPTLLISEYSEASSGYDKYIEIYNPLPTAADLSQYKVWLIRNGGSWPEVTIDLDGLLAAGDVFVVANTKAAPAIRVHADLLTSKMDHNGNDAVGLAVTNLSGGWILLDAVGTDGTNAPANGWDVAGVSEATEDHTLLRKSHVPDGETNWSTSAGTSTANSEWTVLPDGTTTDLGFHGTAPELPPFIAIDQSDITVLVNSPVTYTITVGDFNNDTITLSLDTPPPAGAIFTPALDQVGSPILTNTFDWTPDTPGDYTIDYTATDNDGTVTSSVNIHVSGVLPPPEHVWMNEIHYENDQASANEQDGVEVAGRAGIDLGSYRLFPYDGNGTQEGSKTFTLSGTIPDQQAGYGTVWYDSPSTLENSMEGLVLANIAGGVTDIIQFLSYEGSFAATDGPAKGFVSVDVGVKELLSTAPSNSLQLIGTGNVYADFTWSGPIQDTRGAINTGQTFTPVPTLLILR